MEERKGFNYMHKNKINKKVYIGQTINQDNPNRRWQNGKGYESSDNNLFWNAIQKYGWNNFEHIILEKDIPESLLNKKEKYWIAYYQANNRDFGYNVTDGGQKFISNDYFCETQRQLKNKLYQEHPEIKEKISQSIKKLWENPEYRANMLTKKPNVTGERNPFYGKHHSEETKEKLRNVHLGYKLYSSRCRPVQCIETGEIFLSCADAAEAIGKDRNKGSKCIARAARGESKSSYGFHWKEVAIDAEEFQGWQAHMENDKIKESIKILTSPNQQHEGKPVVNLDTGLIYESCSTAAELLGYTRRDGVKIAQAANGKRLTSLGYRWMFYSEYITLSLDELL